MIQIDWMTEDSTSERHTCSNHSLKIVGKVSNKHDNQLY